MRAHDHTYIFIAYRFDLPLWAHYVIMGESCFVADFRRLKSKLRVYLIFAYVVYRPQTSEWSGRLHIRFRCSW